jgi:hypothetical protein
MTSPSDRTVWITVIYFRLSGWIFFALTQLSDEVISRVDMIWPIKNPVSSKFQISDSISRLYYGKGQTTRELPLDLRIWPSDSRMDVTNASGALVIVV